MKKKYKPRLLTIIVLIILFVVLIVSIVNIVKWFCDNNSINSQVSNINDLVNIEDIDDSDKTITIQQDNITDSNPYWDYIKMKLINVDFSNLKEINKDTVGWIQVNGTNINYPFVQTDNNDYYLTHSFDKSYNQAGWVFLDYRNDINNLDKNTIIYAHGRLDKTMFGSLKNILTSGWLDNANNYVIKLSTESLNSLWQVFSVYKIQTTSDYIVPTFKTDAEFINFTNVLLDRSSFNFNTSVNKDDKILTLSTCYNNDEKVVLHAKLIKMESR